MEIIAGTTDFYLEKETAVVIGKFDGVHVGHRRLLEEILERKREGLCACVFTFDPAPAVLFGVSDGKELTTREEKRLLFERMGVDILIEFPLTFATAAMTPEDFVRDVLAERMQARFLAAGPDLSFGSKGEGNAELLERMGPEYGFTVKIIEKVYLKGTGAIPAGNEPSSRACSDIWQTPQGMLSAGSTCEMPAEVEHRPNILQFAAEDLAPEGVTGNLRCQDGRLMVSSSCVRELLEAGRMELVERMLGMPYLVSGIVASGKQLGRTLGFPTVNLLPAASKLLPPNGVYFSRVRWRDKLYQAISNVGYKPTVTKEKAMGVETYLYQFNKQIYGEPIEVYLQRFRRPERQFESMDALKRQLQDDIAAGERFGRGVHRMEEN